MFQIKDAINQLNKWKYTASQAILTHALRAEKKPAKGLVGVENLWFHLANGQVNETLQKKKKKGYRASHQSWIGKAGLEKQIKAKSYQQIPQEPDHETARTPSGRSGEQNGHHLLPPARWRLYILKDDEVLMWKRPEKLGEIR